MARGRGYESDLKIFFAEIKGLREDETAHFKLQSIDKDGQYVDEQDETELTGRLVKVDSYEDKYGKKLKFVLADKGVGELYVVTTRFTKLARNIINSLAYAADFEYPLTISLYHRKKDGKASVYLSLQGEGLSWKYDWDQYIKPKIKTSQDWNDDGEEYTKYNYHEVDKWLLEEVLLTEVANKVKATNERLRDNTHENIRSEPDAEDGPDTEVVPGVPRGEDGPDDDLPF